ncbi:MAG: PKD domain-containing protein [Bacteroides sp.]|nr:PKD domain-containing protein [Bacteroides sp.]MCM1085976.1 PKD domain-containing protein [Bacteroides sp.]
MKNLRIGLLLVFLMLAGAWLSASENVRLENDQQLPPKTAQADTVRMTWVVESTSSSKSFYFYGEEGATYKVDWGDGETETYTGNGANSQVPCEHSYSTKGTYTVLLYGVASEDK